ncbi:hypothetical protein SCUCBS95973_008683 [Sporothrix curviconia]|uniref:Uncharacterized protein n=1 Tax=Sporothrix curviconia TaxID=1260050 RepID=A0ABP0CNM4_9PEZI
MNKEKPPDTAENLSLGHTNTPCAPNDGLHEQEQAPEMFAGIDLNKIDVSTIDMNQLCEDNAFSMDIVGHDGNGEDTTPQSPQASKMAIDNLMETPTMDLAGALEAEKLGGNVNSWLDELSAPDDAPLGRDTAPNNATAELQDTPMVDVPMAEAAPGNMPANTPVQVTAPASAPLIPPPVSVEDAVLTHLVEAVQSPQHPEPQNDDGVLPDMPAVDEGGSLFVDMLPQIDPDVNDLLDLGRGLDLGPVENMQLLADAPLPGYAWHSVDTMPEEQAIRVLEEAVGTAIRVGREAADVLQKDNSGLDLGLAGMDNSRLDVNTWLGEMASIYKAQDEFQVIVGVSGATGAGKTTMINALLDTHELLPSGSDGAATSTVCLVHKNADLVAKHKFKAVVTFKDKTSVRKWLDPIMQDVKIYYANKKEKQQKDEEEEESDSDESEEGADKSSNGEFVSAVGTTMTRRSQRLKDNAAQPGRTMKQRKRLIFEEEEEEEDDEDVIDTQTLHDKLKSVKGVFGLGLEELEGWTAQKLLDQKEFPIVQCIGKTSKTKTILSDNQQQFSKAVRTYLDSRPLGPDFNFNDYDGTGEESDDDNEKKEEEDDEDEEEEEEEDDKDEGEEEEEDDKDEEEEEEEDDKDEEEEEEEDDKDEEGGEGKAENEDAVDNDKKAWTLPTMLWPLVHQVDIYLSTAPLLENGIVLADVPGLADANEERATVAREMFNRLDITMIVAPVIRATDDATCAEMLSQHETLHLRLNNRLARRSFCVISSKTDDINWENYLKHDVNITTDSALDRNCRVYYLLEERGQNVRDQISNIKHHMVQLQGDHEISEAIGNVDGKTVYQMKKIETETLPGLKKQCDAFGAALDHYQGLLCFSATAWRNTKVRRIIQENFRQRTETLIRAKGKKKSQKESTVVKEGETIDVLPVSAGAYWDVRKHDMRSYGCKPKLGYPEARFSGIPAVRAWIRAATIPMRQRHATSLLKRLSVLLVQLKTAYGGPSTTTTAEDPGSSPTTAALFETPRLPDQGAPAALVSENPHEDVKKILQTFDKILGRNMNACAENLFERVKTCNPSIVKRKKQAGEAGETGEAGEAGGAGEAGEAGQPAPGHDGDCGAATADRPRRTNFKPPCRDRIIAAVKEWPFRRMFKNDQARGGVGGGRGRADAPLATCFVPDIKGRPAKMAWATHAAIIRRNGGYYVSKGKIPGQYTWMRSMAGLVVTDIVQFWEEAMHSHLPQETAAARDMLLDAWDRALTSLRAYLPAYFPQDDHAFLGEQLLALHAIRDCIIDGVQLAMDAMAKQAKTVLNAVEDVLVQGWAPQFARASQESGKGVFKTRQRMLEGFARMKTTPLVKKALHVLDQQFNSNLVDFEQQLKMFWSEGEARIQQQLRAILQRVGHGGEGGGGGGDAGTDGFGSTDIAPQMDARARRINALFHQWEGDWKAPEAYTYVVSGAGGGGGRNGKNAGVSMEAMPTEYIPLPPSVSIETLLPDCVDETGDEDEDGDDDALDAELKDIKQAKPRKRKAAGAAGGGKGKAAPKKRKAAPKKPRQPKAPKAPKASAAAGSGTN